MERKSCPLNTEFLVGALVFFLGSFEYRVTPAARADDTKSQEMPTGSLVGEFYSGDGLSSNSRLRLRSNGTFQFEWTSDADLPVYFSGSYQVARNAVNVTHIARWATERHTPSNLGLDHRYYPVGWGRRLYLIPDEKMTEFCNAVNLGLEPRRGPHGPYYLRDPEWQAPVEGLPTVPESVRRFILEKPAVGAITRRFNDSEAEINLGLRHGVWKGMKLSVIVGADERIVTVGSVAGEKSVIFEGKAQRPGGVAGVGSSVSSAMRKKASSRGR
jgi:hypothetical protein